MSASLQIEHIKKDIDSLQKRYGSPKLRAVYGAGCISGPKILLLFMNPTARNTSSIYDWGGIRAPWIGTKNIWKMMYRLEILNSRIFNIINEGSPASWTEKFARNIYSELNKKSIYITNLAKCTQKDARALEDDIFKAYLENTKEEIYAVNPVKIISFGNQVSSILLNKKVKVSDYEKHEKEVIKIKDKEFDVFPVYYPVGQGTRNIDKAIRRIRFIMNG